jgi:hypothetical protein
MNHHANLGPPADSNPNLDAGLRDLSAALDRLGAIDRGAYADLEDRVLHASLGALHGVQPIAAQAAELGAIDRAAAPRGLEEGVFQESVPALREAASPIVVRHLGPAPRTGREHARQALRPWWSRTSVRIAASLMLFAGVGIAVRSGLDLSKNSTARLSEQVDTQMDTLFAVIRSADTSETSADSDPDRLIEWLSEGSS